VVVDGLVLWLLLLVVVIVVVVVVVVARAWLVAVPGVAGTREVDATEFTMVFMCEADGEWRSKGAV
jgi:flagellar basal body-associated protein FliL